MPNIWQKFYYNFTCLHCYCCCFHILLKLCSFCYITGKTYNYSQLTCVCTSAKTQTKKAHTHTVSGKEETTREREREGEGWGQQYTNKYKNILLRLWQEKQQKTRQQKASASSSFRHTRPTSQPSNHPNSQALVLLVAILCRELSTSLLASPNECRHQNS